MVSQAIVPSAMYVRALYDYDADDRTSLSFRQGDVIQVITQLESGWWDGVIRGIRGWFPSNYCAVISGTDAARGPQLSHDIPTESAYDYAPTGLGIATSATTTSTLGEFEQEQPRLRLETDTIQEEAAFWIPQATPDGRLFYFNTLTGISTMELPLETQHSANDAMSSAGLDFNGLESARPAAEVLAGGVEKNEVPDLETDDSFITANAFASHERSMLANGLSPSLSIDSRKSSGLMRDRSAQEITSQPSFAATQYTNGTAASSFERHAILETPNGLASRSLFVDVSSTSLTWESLVEDMQQAIQLYKQAIEKGECAVFVRRAEDISNHLRLLLAAGSGTTDNHSGNPSIISTNKPLYPHFREMMSSFSKLVLSSHFAASDYTSAESYNKCLQEADGLLHGVSGFVEVARSQRGEEIPRLAPGFLAGTRSGGAWRNQALSIPDKANMLPFTARPDNEVLPESTTMLDATLIDRMEDLKRLITASIRRLDEYLTLHETLITHSRHRQLGDNVCKEAGKILDLCRPYIATVETIDLSTFGTDLGVSQLQDFATHKQHFYDSTIDVVVNCQAVASPLADEWCSDAGISLEDRLRNVGQSGRELERSTTQLQSSVQTMADLVPADAIGRNMTGTSTQPPYTQNGGYQQIIRHRGLSGASGTPRSYTEVAESMSPQQSSKVHRFFGELPATSQATGNESPCEDRAASLGLDHEDEIAFDVKATSVQLRGGSLVALVEQLTRHDKLDSPFNNTFLLTYQSFTTADVLFEMLVERWCIQPPPGLTGPDVQRWIDKKQKPIRFRVVNILKNWFDNYWMEGIEEPAQQLMQKVFSFAKETVASTSTPGAGPLMTAVEQRMRGQDASSKRLILTHSGSTPAAIVPKNIKKLKFLDIDTLEFARQLTCIESKLYHRIKPTECLDKTWQKKLADGEPDPAANVKALILHSNQLTNWVAQMILTQQDVKRRQIVIKHFVSIADKCRGLNNFSTLTSIISALGTAPIHRLSRTWSQVNQKTMATLEGMRALMGSTKNFLEYRETLHKANPPCIPFFGVYLTDLTFIEDGIPSIIKKTNLINFAKRAKTADVIREIQQYQAVPYQLHSVPELQDYILKNMQTAGDVHEMYERSLQVEPREREDEKIARLLSESGFL